MKTIFMFVVGMLMCSCNPKQTEGIVNKIHTQTDITTLNDYKEWKGFKKYCDKSEIPYDLELWQTTSYENEYLYIKVDDVFRLKTEINHNDTIYSLIHQTTK